MKKVILVYNTKHPKDSSYRVGLSAIVMRHDEVEGLIREVNDCLIIDARPFTEDGVILAAKRRYEI